MNIGYSMLIQWSNEDQLYIVSFPEFGEFCKTHGKSYRSAAKNGQEVLELLVRAYRDEGRQLPKPNTYCLEPPVKRRPRPKPKAHAV